MPDSRDGLLLRLFSIRPDEAPIAWRLAFYQFAVVASMFIIGRTVGSSLFLHRIDPRWLPYTYVLSAVFVSLAASVFSRWADRVDRDRMAALSSVGFAGAIVALWLAVGRYPTSLAVMATIYVAYDIMGTLVAVQFWNLAGEMFPARQSKRVFAVVGLGGTSAGVIAGGLLGPAAKLVGTANLMLLSVAILLAAGGLAWNLGRHAPEKVRAPGPSPTSGRSSKRSSFFGDLRRVVGDEHLRLIGLFMALGTVSTTLIDYQWKISARAAFLHNEAGLTAYFGYFALAVGLVSLVSQGLLTSRVLTKYGVGIALAMLPALLLIGSGIMAAAWTAAMLLWAASFAKGGDGVLRYTVQVSATQLLFRPVDPSFRGRAKVLLSAVGKPISSALGGLLLVLLLPLVPARWVIAIQIPLIVAWLWVALRLRKTFAKTLNLALRGYRPPVDDAFIMDEATVKAVSTAIASQDPRQVINGLHLLEAHPDDRVTVPLARLLSTGDDDVAKAALACVLSQHTATSLEEVVPSMDASDLRLRALAIAAVVRLGGLASLLSAVRKLDQMLTSPEAALRAAAARTVGRIGDPRFYEPVLTLLADDDDDVRKAACWAAERVPNPILRPQLIRLLDEVTIRGAAARALVAQGPEAIEDIANASIRQPTKAAGLTMKSTFQQGVMATGVLAENPRAPSYRSVGSKLRASGRQAAMQVLGRLGASDMLVRGLKDRALGVRLEAARALDRCKNSTNQADLRSAALHHVQEIELWRVARLQCVPHRTTLLMDALMLRENMLTEMVLCLVGALHPVLPTAKLVRSLVGHDHTRKSEALDLLDNTLDSDIKQTVLNTLDPQGDDRSLLASLCARHPDWRATREQTLQTLMTDRDPWLRVCAVLELGTQRPNTLQLMSRDPDPLVRETVQHLLTPHQPRSTMIPTVERILFLRSVSLFREVPAELLTLVAKLADEQRIAAGDALMREGEDGRALYVLVEGTVRVFSGGKMVATLTKGECVGEMSLLDAQPRSATVVAEVDTLTLRIDQESFYDLLAEQSALAKSLLVMMSARLRACGER